MSSGPSLGCGGGARSCVQPQDPGDKETPVAPCNRPKSALPRKPGTLKLAWGQDMVMAMTTRRLQMTGRHRSRGTWAWHCQMSPTCILYP